MDIPDYLILSDTNGTYDTNILGYKYALPPTWYSNHRSSVACVSMIQFAYEQDNSAGVVGYVTTSLPSQNTRYNQEGQSVLGLLTPNTDATPALSSNSWFDTNEPIKHLTAARPPQFNIFFKTMDGTATNPDTFMLVLKFEYYSPAKTSRALGDEYTPTLNTVGGGIANYYPNSEISLTSLRKL